MSEIAKLPKIGDLYADKELTTRNTEFAVLCNQPPFEAWIKTHPLTNLKYIPIEVIEYLLTRIFGKWKVEIKTTQLIANSIVVTIRLYVIDPVTGKEDWQDGVGASPIQTDKGAGATEFDKIKSAAVMMAAPAAETFAIKDAAEKFGKLFGKDLNRKEAIAYGGLIEVNEKRFKSLENEQ